MPELCEGSAYWHGLLTIMEGGADFSFSGGCHHVVENIGDGVDRTVGEELVIGGLVGSVDWSPRK